MPRLQQSDLSGTMSCKLRTPGLREGDCPSEPSCESGKMDAPLLRTWLGLAAGTAHGIYAVRSIGGEGCPGDLCLHHDTMGAAVKMGCL